MLRHMVCAIITIAMNYLRAVFWDYPWLASPSELKAFIESHKTHPRVYRWLLRRFLENGRAVDTLRYFAIQEIAACLHDSGLTEYTRKKWQRIIEVYEHP